MRKQINKKLDRVPRTSLVDKQSVRTTFNLSEGSNDAINFLIKTNNLKPKELFDLICSNENLVELAIEATKKIGKSNSTKQKRKTFVISKRVLRMLNRHSEKYKLSRDLIVENLILLFKALLEKHAEEEKQQEEKAYVIISEFVANAESFEKQLEDLLDDDNPILDRFGFGVQVFMNLEFAVESKLSNNISVDPDDISQT